MDSSCTTIIEMTDIFAYFQKLFGRINEAFVVERHIIGDNLGWEPNPRECHRNVERLVGARPEYRPVHGWLICDYGDRVQFIAHSIVRSTEGKYIDITPVERSLPWTNPFLIDCSADYWAIEQELYLNPVNPTPGTIVVPALTRTREEIDRISRKVDAETRTYIAGLSRTR